MDNLKVEIIKDSLKKLISNGAWLLTISLIALFAKIQNIETIGFGQFSINYQLAGWFLLSVCFIITLSLLKNYDSIISVYKHIDSDENKNIAKLYLNSYSSLLNPFAEQEGSERSSFIDIWGYTTITIAPIFSFFISILYINLKTTFSIIIFIALALIITLFRSENIIAEKYAIYTFCPYSEKKKRITSIVTMILLIIIGIIFSIYK